MIELGSSIICFTNFIHFEISNNKLQFMMNGIVPWSLSNTAATAILKQTWNFVIAHIKWNWYDNNCYTTD